VGDLKFDVCIIGGGPAGVAAGLRVLEAGHTVCIVERDQFPRGHVGESLSRGALRLLDSIGLTRAFQDARPRPSNEARISWAEERAVRKTGHAWLVDRAPLDLSLLCAARRSGITVFQPGRAHARELPDGWCVAVEGLQPATIACDVLIDAAGRVGAIRGRRVRYSPPTLALWGTFAARAGETRLEALAEGWIWAGPLSDDRLSVMFVCDPAHVKRGGHGSIEATLRATMSNSSLLAEFSGGRLLSPVLALDASCTYSGDTVGARHVRAGEAGHTLDPLSSSGVEAALRSGISAAAVANSILDTSTSIGICRQFLEDRVEELVKAQSAWMAGYYGQVERFALQPFWSRRGSRAQARGVAVQPTAPAMPRRQANIQVNPMLEIGSSACLLNNRIALVPVVKTSQLPTSVGFVNGIPIVPLIGKLRGLTTWRSVNEVLSNCCSADQRDALANWLWSSNVIVHCD